MALKVNSTLASISTVQKVYIYILEKQLVEYRVLDIFQNRGLSSLVSKGIKRKQDTGIVILDTTSRWHIKIVFDADL